MAGAGMSVSAKGGRRPVDAAINLVPFIDLLSCCISFLLITAVWVNLGRMPVASKDGGPSDSPPAEPPQVRVNLLLHDGGYVLSRSTGESLSLPRQGGQLDARGLGQALMALRGQLPKQHDMTLQAADSVHYAELIQTMDIAHGAEFVNVQVSSPRE